MNTVVQEVASHKHVPILVAADWSEEPDMNVVVGLLGDENYHAPLTHLDGDTVGRDLPAHFRNDSSRLLDYWILSLFHHLTTRQQVIRMPNQHAAVMVELPRVKIAPPAHMIPNRVDYKLESIVHSTPVDWQTLEATIENYLQNDQISLALALWSDSWHRELAASSTHSPRTSTRGVSQWLLECQGLVLLLRVKRGLASLDVRGLPVDS